MNVRAAAVFIVLGISACSSFGGTSEATSDGGSGGDADASTLNPVPGTSPGGIGIVPVADRAFVIQGGAVDIPIHIRRSPEASDEVAFSFGPLPAGISLTAKTIPANKTDGVVHVQASADAAQASVDVDIMATTTTNRVSTKGALPFFVRGAAGTVDTTFAPDALAITVPTTGAFSATLTGLSDGTMIVAGTVGNSARLVKVDAQGKSVAFTNLGTGSRIAPLADGRLLNFGSNTIERFSSMLALDSGLGPGGFANVDAGSVLDVATFGGKVIVLTTHANITASGNFDSFDITRFTTDGVPDGTFAGCSAACAPGSFLRVGVHPLAVDNGGQARAFVGCGYPDEKVVFGCGVNGGRNLGGDEPAGLSASDGASYPTIVKDGSGGYFKAEYLDDPPSPTLQYATQLVHMSSAGSTVGSPFVNDLFGIQPALALQSDGSVIIANGAGPDRLLALRRFKSSGTEDSAFVHSDPGAGVKTPYGMLLQSDGRIVVLTSRGGMLIFTRYWS